MDVYFEQTKKKIVEQAAGRDVLLLISGGVDSAVVAGLLLKSLPAEKYISCISIPE